MASQIPGAEFCLIAGGSHAAPVEQPKTIHERIEKFTRSHVR
jgi:pimeloyl-ACP methyl ester carboxylesterase